MIVAIAWPDSYRVTATVAVEPARLPDDVKPLVESSIQDRIERLCRVTVSDALLGEIARNCPRLARPRFLHVFEGGASSPQETVREKIAIERRGRGDRTELVLVTVTGEKADETAYVASRLAGVLVALDREFRVSAASAIHSSTLARTVDAGPLDELKRRIELLRTQNPLIATSSDAAIRAQLDQETRARDEDQIADAEVAASLPLLADEVRSWNRAVLDEAEIAQRNAATDATRAQGTGREADDPRRARLVELQRQLVQSLSHWTEQNPEVKRLRLEIKLERARLGEPEPEDEDAPSAPLEKRTGLAPRNVADARPAADTTTQAANRFMVEAPSYRNLREAISRYEAAKSRDAALKARIQTRTTELARLHDQVDKLPERRLELSRLDAERERLEQVAVTNRLALEKVERAWRIEKGDGRDGVATERLSLAGAVVTPDRPIGPDRLWIFLMGLLVSFPVAALAAYVRDAQDRSVHTDEEAARVLDLPVLGVIPRIRGRR